MNGRGASSLSSTQPFGAAYARRISLDLRDLGGDRGGLPIFRGASFRLKPGEAVQIFGANGAGKSSLLGVLAGHFPASEGTVYWRDGNSDDWREDKPPREAVLFLGHERGAMASLTVVEHLDFWRARYRRPSMGPERVTALLSRLRLENYADEPAARLSAGQKRRLDFARLIIAARPVWLLDEPTAFVDEAGSALFASLVADHLKRGGVAIAATHERLAIGGFECVIGQA
ncbi:MAG: heme ABC exporter ATP-binding protein CcmA [Pseudomonadota bacterium]